MVRCLSRGNSGQLNSSCVHLLVVFSKFGFCVTGVYMACMYGMGLMLVDRLSSPIGYNNLIILGASEEACIGVGRNV